MPVPGAFELPLAAMALAKTRRYACVVALGAIVRGETPHFDYIAGEAASGLQLAAIETGVPVAFGVLTVETVEQAEARIERAADAVRRRSRWPTSSRSCAPARRTRSRRPATLSPMSKVCSVCGKGPGSGTIAPLDGRDEASLRSESPARPRARERRAARAYVCTRCLKGGKVQKAV